jgi:hypothetical protein
MSDARHEHRDRERPAATEDETRNSPRKRAVTEEIDGPLPPDEWPWADLPGVHDA